MYTFKHGVHPNEQKELAKDKPIKVINAGKTLVFPLQQHIGAKAKATVKVGDSVLVGQIIGEADGFISANVLSSVSGKVTAIEDRLVVGGQKVESIIVENDEKYDAIKGFGVERDLNTLSNEDILKAVKDAGIVGLGGASFPTHVKLAPKDPSKIDYVLVNGAECEPYLTSDYRLMLEETEMLIKGLQSMLKLFPNAKGIICVEDNKKDAFDKITLACKGIPNIETALMKTKYPQGGERQLIFAITGRKINVSKLPADVGVVVDNVDTVVSIGYAVCKSTPLLRRIMTLSGDAYNETANLNVRFGISYKEVIDAVGGFKAEPKKMVSGGPMMGLPIFSLDMPVSRNSSALLAFLKDPTEGQVETNCINCGRCVSACPINLLPTRMYKAAKAGDFDTYIKLNGPECITCGSCSFVCPAKKPLTPYFSYMKFAVRGYLNSKKEK
ncbi:MAG: electron transport complex subunit RsxC, partial [Lachnospiraceae bacterium]|nr:electron transport complex subunit RsxC [Lachnospiraceae bacterium]